MVAPRDTPPAIVAEINRQIIDILQAPDVVEKIRAVGMEPSGNSPAAFENFIKMEAQKWMKPIKALGLQLD